MEVKWLPLALATELSIHRSFVVQKITYGFLLTTVAARLGLILFHASMDLQVPTQQKLHPLLHQRHLIIVISMYLQTMGMGEGRGRNNHKGSNINLHMAGQKLIFSALNHF